MKPTSCKILTVFALTTLGLTLTGCQQAPPTAASSAPVATTAQAAPAPVATTESSSSSRSVEVKSDSSSPDGSGVTVKKESTTEKRQSQ
jgi:hypothetical protein